MRSILGYLHFLITLTFWWLVGCLVILVSVAAALGAEPACVTPNDVLARVQRDINAKSVSAMMTPAQTEAFAAATHFPYDATVFQVVVTPAIVGVFAYDADGCAIAKDGSAATTTDDPMVMMLDHDQLRQIMSAINASVI